MHDFLDVGDVPEKADCIFVYAGRPERKTFGLRLWHEGYAGRIIFSVDRFEWRSFLRLGLEHAEGLRELVQNTPPSQRHFFVEMDLHDARFLLIERGRFGTWSEARALSEIVQRQNIRTLIVVSTAFHLRRACAALKKLCPGDQLRIIPVAVPELLTSDARTNWWKRRKGFSLIVKEYVKCLCYKLILPVKPFRAVTAFPGKPGMVEARTESIKK